jgi:hypothetical protein
VVFIHTLGTGQYSWVFLERIVREIWFVKFSGRKELTIHVVGMNAPVVNTYVVGDALATGLLQSFYLDGTSFEGKILDRFVCG